MFLLLILYALFASTFILGKEAIALVAPIFFVGVRMVIAGGLLLCYVKFFTKQSFKITRKQWPWFVGIVLFHIYFSYVLEFVSYQYLSGSYVALINNLAPFVTALFAYMFLTEKLTKTQWVGIALGFVAALPMAIAESTPGAEAISPLFKMLAQLSVLLSVVALSIGWIFLKKITTEWNYSYVFVNGFGMFFGGLLSLLTSYYLEPWPVLSTIFTNGYFMMILFASIFIGNVIVYNLWGKLLQKYSATTVSFFGCTTPLFAALIDWLWLGKAVGPLFIITVITTSIGLYLFYQDELNGGAGNAIQHLVQDQEQDAAR